jgi:hypothetical protein
MVPTTGKNGFQDVPIENIVIERVTIKWSEQQNEQTNRTQYQP